MNFVAEFSVNIRWSEPCGLFVMAIRSGFEEEVIGLGQKQRTQREGGMAPEILREYRKAKKESQFRFWSRFGVTQSRGSRFEMGTEIPPSIVILLKLYFDGIVTDGDLWRAKRRWAHGKLLIADATGGSAHDA